MSRNKKLESGFQDSLKAQLEEMFPDCMVLKQDAIQGIPDLLVLHKDRWASLECKKSKSAKKQPNQDYYVDKMDNMSFSRFVYPENRDEVLNELRQVFEK